MLPKFGQRLAGFLFGRRFLSAVLLAVYVVTAAGIPLPSGAQPHASNEEYPCAHCACGCTSAEQCWRSCCCHTLAERIAWAEEHKVRPPEYAIAAAQVAGIDVSWLGIKSLAKHSSPPPSCCSRVANSSLPPCCQKRLAACEKAEHDCCEHKAASNPASHGDDGIVALRALGCQGQSLNWLAAVPTLIVARPEVSQTLPRVVWLGPATSEVAESVPFCPDVPPPERA